MTGVRHASPARALLWLVALGGLAVAVRRYLYGLGAVSHLSDRFPWGLWVGFDILCGVALAAGGFTMAAIVHILHLKRYEPLLRPAIVTGFLGYLLVIIALMVDLGRPYRIWHALVMWNPHSVMFEVAWCVMLYTLVLALEFGQSVLERTGRTALLRLTHLALPPLVVVGVILSTLHQSSLGSLFLIVPGKLHPLWYSSWLPVLFFLSALAVGMAMVTVEAVASARAFGRTLELPLLADLGKGTFAVLAVYLAVRVADVVARGVWVLASAPTLEAALFRAELWIGGIAPLVLLAAPRIRRSAPGLAAAASLVVLGVVLNRLNVTVTGMLAASGARYVPSWMEVLITAAIVAAGLLAYLWIVEHLPVFGEEARPGAPAAAIVPAGRSGAPAPPWQPRPAPRPLWPTKEPMLEEVPAGAVEREAESVDRGLRDA
ncbi:MAG: Ni/Fe-hydrogenase cytochrome b subunit [Armatimonadota bacterium]|nr:Ni/Fe-hydrogenase cytochrome b subunit [Armatimonadota bacterium]MDR7518710.1 Ni/Fe-hydrogenase cytochrome b subunit [Armatimonadota bacterium]MDR7550034.1 Ni/Fe-hydrogenase cytochrome b subunit [Armatimonadota bacterium]